HGLPRHRQHQLQRPRRAHREYSGAGAQLFPPHGDGRPGARRRGAPQGGAACGPQAQGLEAVPRAVLARLRPMMSFFAKVRATVKDVYAPLETRPSRRDLIQFGLIVLVGAGAIGAACYFRLLEHYAPFHWMRPELALPIWIVGGAT